MFVCLVCGFICFVQIINLAVFVHLCILKLDQELVVVL